MSYTRWKAKEKPEDDKSQALTCLLAVLIWLGSIGVSIVALAGLVYVVIWAAMKALGL